MGVPPVEPEAFPLSRPSAVAEGSFTFLSACVTGWRVRGALLQRQGHCPAQSRQPGGKPKRV